MGLPQHFECALGAAVLLILNLAVQSGLINGSQGTIAAIGFHKGHHPNHDNLACRMPCVIVVHFPDYVGPAFFTDPDKAKWVPITPITRKAVDDAAVTRTQFPLTLAFALTPWKAQGMTLAKEELHTENAASTPGVLFTALTRIRHPDTLKLNDNFPSYAQIMKTRTNRSFAMRQHWERKARAKFSRTIRRHMRDPDAYTTSKTWSHTQSALADQLPTHYGSNTDIHIDDLPARFCDQHSQTDISLAEEVWSKMQTFPHCFEIAEKRNALHTLNLDGSPRATDHVPAALTELHHNEWKVPVDALDNFCTLGIITPSVLELMAHTLRTCFSPDTHCFLRHDILRNRKLSLLMKTQPRRPPKPLPATTFIPYLSESKFWSLFVLRRHADSSSFALDCFFAHGAKDEAFQSTVRYVQSICPMHEEPTIHKASDNTIGDGIILAFIYAAFLQTPLQDVFDDTTTALAHAQDIFKDILRDAALHNEPSMNIIFARDQDLRRKFYAMFSDAANALPGATHRSRKTVADTKMSPMLAKAYQEFMQKLKRDVVPSEKPSAPTAPALQEFNRKRSVDTPHAPASKQQKTTPLSPLHASGRFSVQLPVPASNSQTHTVEAAQAIPPPTQLQGRLKRLRSVPLAN